MFIDEAKITVEGGDGGNGKVAYFKNKSGPCGGNGGKGGNLYFRVDSNLVDLKKYSKTIAYKAENGQPGGPNRRIGVNGKDLYLPVPPNTSIIDSWTNQEITLTAKFPSVLFCKGGNGGFGNEMFKTSTNQTPRYANLGQKGKEKKIALVLKLIADFGLIGLPNAGKSSLLNELTNAQAKIASYPFTTLEPNLGVIEGKVIADIPGLIEGASTGKGLGIRFLKHIEKVSLLLHCISSESENMEQDYQTVMAEISKYNQTILGKKTIILLTKIDLIEKDVIKSKMKILKKFGFPIIPISIYDVSALNKIRKVLLQK